MNPAIASIVLLGLNFLVYIYTLSPTITTPVSIIFLVMSMIILTNTYFVGTQYVHLEEKARRNRVLIEKQKKEIKSNQKKLKHTMDELASKERGRIDEELSRIAGTKGKREELFKTDYWNKLEKKASVEVEAEDERVVRVLESKRDEINGLIELSKKKFSDGLLDEASLSSIVRDYHKKLIEVENKLKTIKEGRAGRGKGADLPPF